MTLSRDTMQAYAAGLRWLTADPDNDNWAFAAGPPAVDYQTLYPIDELSDLGDTQVSIDAYRTAKHAELAATTGALNAASALQRSDYGQSYFNAMVEGQAQSTWTWTSLWTQTYAEWTGNGGPNAYVMRVAPVADQILAQWTLN